MIIVVLVLPIVYINVRRHREGGWVGGPDGNRNRPRRASRPPKAKGARLHAWLSKIPTGILWLVVLLWTIPTAGLLINSFREPVEQRPAAGGPCVQDPSFTLDAYDRALTNVERRLAVDVGLLPELACRSRSRRR